ncbi:MAG: hypothetical protein DRO98_00835 [Archaeoglobales archaeon]|nr:MAG: hypothetical protein DRO98_00835 [Archaeoglobales archaeon]
MITNDIGKSYQLLEDFEEYCYEIYSEEHARKLYSAMKKYGLKILQDKRNAVLLANIGRRAAEYVIVALSIYNRFMKLNGIELDIDRELLKKHIRKEETIKIFDYEEDEGIIDKATSMLEKVKGKRGFLQK